MHRFTIAALMALSLTLVACPKKGNPEPTPQPTAPNEATSSTDLIRYHWSGGFSILDFYTLTVTPATDGKAQVDFKMRPIKGEERQLSGELSADEYAELRGLMAGSKFREQTQAPRGMKIHDIGRTVITWKSGSESHELYEDPDTRTSGDLREIRAWFDHHVRLYLETASKPEEKKE